MAVHLEAKVGQFFTHQASESLLCSAHERCTVLSSARGATLQYQGVKQITLFLTHVFFVFTPFIINITWPRVNQN